MAISREIKDDGAPYASFVETVVSAAKKKRNLDRASRLGLGDLREPAETSGGDGS